jgi:putative transposase
VSLPTFHTFADTDPLNRRVVEQMLVGVATRQYGRSLEPTGGDVVTRGTSKSSVSRRFVVRTTAQLNAWRSTSLEALDLVTLIVDSVHVAEHCVVVALGIDTTGKKHALGLWDVSTENTTVCQSLLANLQSRGLRTDRSLLIILDGSKALHRAVSDLFGQAALDSAVSSPQAAECVGTSARAAAAVGSRDPQSRLSACGCGARPAIAAGSRSPIGRPVSQCRGKCSGRP